MGFPAPDIIKVDVSLLRIMGDDWIRMDRLKNIVAQASDMDQEVVVVGIDSGCDIEDVERAGLR